MSEADSIAELTAQQVERFWANFTDRDPSKCWIWPRKVSRRHAGVMINSYKFGVHRLAWMLANGPIPDDLFVLHNCPGGDNPRCCNPTHLFLGTSTDNMADRDAKGRQPRGERHGNSIYIEDEIRLIRRLHREGWSVNDLIRRFRRGKSCLYKIVQRRAWKHVADEPDCGQVPHGTEPIAPSQAPLVVAAESGR